METDRSGFTTLVLPTERSSVMRYGISAFLLFWLGGWAMGWVSAFRQITSNAKGAAPFLVFWLSGWTVGGFLAGAFLWRLLRRTIPEMLIFAKPNLIYDTGVQSPLLGWNYRHQKDMWKRMFEKRKRIQFTPEDLATIRLRDTESDNRLTIDYGSDRMDLGRALTEVERESLFKLIRDEYKI